MSCSANLIFHHTYRPGATPVTSKRISKQHILRNEGEAPCGNDVEPSQRISPMTSGRHLQGTARWRELAIIYMAVASDALSIKIMTPFVFLWLKDGMKYSDAEFKSG